MMTIDSIRRLSVALAAPLLLATGLPVAAAQWTKRVDTWYLQTIATNSSGAVDNRSGVIGHIHDAAAGFDKHDVPAFSSVIGAPVAVIFHQGESWGEHAGEYLSDYRAPGKDKQVWDFTVTTSDPNDTVTLSWDGLHLITRRGARFDTQLDARNKGLRRLRLVDLSLGEVATRAANADGSLATYTFQMGGVTERHFRWISGKPTDEELHSSDAQPVNADGAQGASAGASLRMPSAPVTAPLEDFPAPPALMAPVTDTANP